MNRIQLPDHMFELQARAAVRYSNALPLLQGDNQTRAFFELHADLPLAERYARAQAYAMANERAIVFPDEQLQGQFYDGWNPSFYMPDERWVGYTADDIATPRVAREIPELDELRGRHLEQADRTYIINEGISPGHVAWNYHWVLADGIEPLLAKHRAAIAAAKDDKARDYYQGAAICLQAILDWNDKHIEALQAALDATDDPEARERIIESMDVLTRVPAQGARTFREAVQSFYFIWLAVIYESPYGGNGPGRLDYFLWPYLEAELRDGTISFEAAGELVAELFIKIDERIHIHDGNVNALVVGGVGPDGQDTVNPLTTIMLDVIEQLDLTHPSVYARVHDGSSPEYVDRCVAYLLNGGNRAQVLVDEPILKALVETQGLTPEDAALYTCGGCMEINSHGMNSDLQFAYWYNVPKTLELAITGGEDLLTGKPRLAVAGSLATCETFDAFYGLFESEMRRTLHAKFRELDIYSEVMAAYRPTYLLSALTDDCFERGREQQDGGARHSVYGGAPLGIQNAADALHAINVAVFEEAFVSAADLVAALRTDFVGYESLRAKLLAIPKFGQECAAADAMMNRVLQSVCAVHSEYVNRHGWSVRPIVFTFTWASEMGEALGASPDGRRAGQAIGHGLTPQSLAMDCGITAAMQSYLSLDTSQVTGGASTMWDMDGSTVTFPTLRAVFETFRRGGGMIFQGNTTDVAELEAALEKPEEYDHLIVRVGGFSARFNILSERVQREIIERHRH
jgi:trans-4-hydroxy-L-proline dehydratase